MVTATVNDWGAICFRQGEFHEATMRKGLEILDRVGGGDSFASGLIYGFLEGMTPSEAVNYGAAHGALAMTTERRHDDGPAVGGPEPRRRRQRESEAIEGVK